MNYWFETVGMVYCGSYRLHSLTTCWQKHEAIDRALVRVSQNGDFTISNLLRWECLKLPRALTDWARDHDSLEPSRKNTAYPLSRSSDDMPNSVEDPSPLPLNRRNLFTNFRLCRLWRFLSRTMHVCGCFAGARWAWLTTPVTKYGMIRVNLTPSCTEPQV